MSRSPKGQMLHGCQTTFCDTLFTRTWCLNTCSIANILHYHHQYTKWYKITIESLNGAGLLAMKSACFSKPFAHTCSHTHTRKHSNYIPIYLIHIRLQGSKNLLSKEIPVVAAYPSCQIKMVFCWQMQFLHLYVKC